MLLDYLELLARGRTLSRAPIHLSEYALTESSAHGGSLFLEVRGPDHTGFLGAILERLAFLSLSPVEMRIETLDRRRARPVLAAHARRRRPEPAGAEAPGRGPGRAAPALGAGRAERALHREADRRLGPAVLTRLAVSVQLSACPSEGSSGSARPSARPSRRPASSSGRTWRTPPARSGSLKPQASGGQHAVQRLLVVRHDEAGEGTLRPHEVDADAVDPRVGDRDGLIVLRLARRCPPSSIWHLSVPSQVPVKLSTAAAGAARRPASANVSVALRTFISPPSRRSRGRASGRAD